ncbi:MAG: hypothetical protein KBS91_04160 [Firmicutes bacterium]|nr:hypothetical protein [Candidatus Caballimonas caccae]
MKQEVLIQCGYDFPYEIVTVETEDDIREVINELKEKWYEEDYGETLIEFLNDKLKKRYKDIEILDISEIRRVTV